MTKTGAMQLENMRWLDDKALALAGKRLLCRLDLDTPCQQTGQLGHLSGLLNMTQTLSYALQQGAQIVAVGHLGDPKGKFRQHLSLYPIADYLQQRLQCEVIFVHDGIGDGARHLASGLKKGQILMLENLMFDRGEQGNHFAFAKQLAQLAQIYVNDAFSCCPYHYASLTTAAQLFSCRVGGLALRRQLEILHMMKKNLPRPVVAVLGGDQQEVQQTLPLVTNLLSYVDEVLLGGHMAHTCLSAGVAITTPHASSTIRSTQQTLARKLWQFCQRRSIAVTLPQDLMISSPENHEPICIEVNPQVATQPIPLDIGPQTCKLFTSRLQQAGTVVLLDCVGQWQQPQHNNGMAALFSSMTQGPKTRIIIGRDAVQAYYHHPHNSPHVFHLLNSSAAALAVLGAEALPGLQML